MKIDIVKRRKRGPFGLPKVRIPLLFISAMCFFLLSCFVFSPYENVFEGHLQDGGLRDQNARR